MPPPFARKAATPAPPPAGGNDRLLAHALARLDKITRDELAAGSKGIVGVELAITDGSIRRVEKIIRVIEPVPDLPAVAVREAAP